MMHECYGALKSNRECSSSMEDLLVGFRADLAGRGAGKLSTLMKHQNVRTGLL